MPMHDWSRVDPNDCHDMRVGWIAALRHHPNTGGRPPGYLALAEHTAPPVVPDEPLFLSAERYVTVPLEATYQTGWAGFPAALRPLVEPPTG